MSELERLIQELCPNGVPFKSLGSIATVTAGNSAPQKAELFQGGIYPFCRTSDVGRVKKSIDFSDITDKLNTDGIKGMRLFPAGSILIPKSGASTLLNNKVRLAVDAYVVSHLAVVIPNTAIINSRYLYYAVEGFDMSLLVEDKSYPSVKSSKIAESIFIPVPPIEVQCEIVRILDNFKELTEELTEELTARKKQYEYYKESLLTFEQVEYVSLGDVSNVVAGGTPSKKVNEYWEAGDIKWLGSTVCKNQKTVDEVTNYITSLGLEKSSAKMMPKETTLIALVGATIGKVAFLPFEASINQNIAGIYSKDKNKLDPSYLYYACAMLYPKFFALTQESKLAMANLSFVRGLKIPLPSIDAQREIASILDRFDAICNDISAVLPDEIEASQKQYEYYRDKLLTFKELLLE